MRNLTGTALGMSRAAHRVSSIDGTMARLMDSRLRQLADQLFVQSDAGVIRPASIASNLLPHLFILDIEQLDVHPQLQLRIRLTGTAVDQIFGKPIGGRLLEEFVHGPRGDQVISGFHNCAKTHEPIWMRQIVHIQGKAPRFVEGIAIHLAPSRIVGGLVAGLVSTHAIASTFEREVLIRAGQASLIDSN